MIDAIFSFGQGLFPAVWWSSVGWPIVWALIKIVVVVLPLMGAVAYLTLWERKFLGYSFTWHKAPRLKISSSSVGRLKDKIRSLTTGHSTKSVEATIRELTPVLRGWISYFRWTQIKGVLEELDGWIRRKLRCLLWRQWKRPESRVRMLMKAGLDRTRAKISAYNQHGAWWNAGASHMNQAYRKRWFEKLGLVSLLECHQQFQR